LSRDEGNFIVFVDESGDHGLERVDPGYPVFVLAFCVTSQKNYARKILPAVTEFKFRHFHHDQVVLHERDIRKDIGEFSGLRDKHRKQAFLDELSGLIATFDLAVIASVIRKDLLIDKYRFPSNPYEIALAFGLERVHKWLKKNGETGQTSVIIEKRGKREDNELELEFRRICSGANFFNVNLDFEPRFVPKAANVPGLQIADLIARPIGRHVLDPDQPNRAWEVIEKKMVRSPQGKVTGWGLKIFP
jgi:hypothetical protein